MVCMPLFSKGTLLSDELGFQVFVKSDSRLSAFGVNEVFSVGPTKAILGVCVFSTKVGCVRYLLKSKVALQHC